MKIQLIYCADCPNVDAARKNLQEAVASLGLAVHIEEFDTTGPSVPPHLLAYGSPTILVNDADVAGPTGLTGQSCRLYPGPDRVPSVETIRTALDRAHSS